MKVFFSERYAVETGSPAPLEKLAYVAKALRGYEGFDLREPQPATTEDLERVHDRRYVEAVRTGRPDQLAESQGFTWSPRLFEATSLAVGGCIEAAYAALQDGVAGNIAYGFHHAKRERGEGYCTFNGLAVAIKRLQSDKRIARALVVDGDVHFGNGTARIFLEDPSVFTFSVHGIAADPVPETETNRKIKVRDAEGYRRAFGELPGIMDTHRPDVILYLASVDGYCQDPFSTLGLQERDLRERDRFVFRQAKARHVPIAFVTGAGYGRGEKLHKVVQLHTNTFLEAAGAFERV